MSSFSPIHTERLVLREFEPHDWQGAHEYLSDPEVLQYMEYYPGSEEQSQRYVDTMLEFQKQEPRKHIKFVAELKESGNVIGECGLLINDHRNENGELCFRFSRSHWCKGFATEAARAMLKLGFQRLRLHRINATCDMRNAASIRVLEKIGMQREGCLREHKWVKEDWITSLIYSVLEQEFKQSEKLYTAV